LWKFLIAQFFIANLMNWHCRFATRHWIFIIRKLTIISNKCRYNIVRWMTAYPFAERFPSVLVTQRFFFFFFSSPHRGQKWDRTDALHLMSFSLLSDKCGWVYLFSLTSLSSSDILECTLLLWRETERAVYHFFFPQRKTCCVADISV